MMADALRREEELNRLLRRCVPKSRHRQRADAAQGHYRRMEQEVGELWRQTVARRIARKVGDQCAKAPTRRRLRRLARCGAGNLIGGLELADHPLDRTETLVAFAPDLPGEPCQQS